MKSKQFGVIGVCKTVEPVPRIVFADRTPFRRYAQSDVEVVYLIESLATHSICEHENLVRIFEVKQRSR